MDVVDSDLFRQHLQFFPLQVREEWEEFCGWLETFPIRNVIEIGTHARGLGTRSGLWRNRSGVSRLRDPGAVKGRLQPPFGDGPA
jgi:hypothetical protein